MMVMMMMMMMVMMVMMLIHPSPTPAPASRFQCPAAVRKVQNETANGQRGCPCTGETLTFGATCRKTCMLTSRYKALETRLTSHRPTEIILCTNVANCPNRPPYSHNWSALTEGKVCNQKARSMSGLSIHTICLHAQQRSVLLLFKITVGSQQLFRICNYNHQHLS